MRTLKDKERILIICRIYLDIKGQAAAKELTNYINTCPVKIQTDVTPVKIASLLKKHKIVGKLRTKPTQYYIRKGVSAQC